MVGRVLRNHSIVEKERNEYILKSFDTLSEEEIEELIELCDLKIQEYIFLDPRLPNLRKKRTRYLMRLR
jgi:hypothetical protein